MSKPGIVEGFLNNLAVLVAIDNYVGGVPVLQTPVVDAEKLAEVLRDNHGFDTEVVKNEDATFDKFKALLADLQTRVGKDDRVLFYFAGHGIALESDDGPKGYILPQDADQISADRYLPMVELNQALSALPCRHMLVILDCCFAGALRWASTRDLIFARTNLHQERYQWFIRDAAWEAIASAAQDQKAMDIAAGRPLGVRDQTTAHSPFAQALIDGLTGLADLRSADQPGDGVITATELFVYLRDRLMPAPGSGRPRQTPILWPLPKHDKGEFVFLVPGRDLNLPPAPPFDSKANPWLGLETYDSTQSELFFGRRGVSEALVARVLRDPLVVVTGPSGIGKSSLVRAGLLPRLKVLPIVPIVFRPGPAPFAALAAALHDMGRADVKAPGEQALKSDPMTLATWIATQGDDRQFLLVIDQAEELITQNRDAKVQSDFLTLIDKALDQAERRQADIQHFAEAEARASIEAMGYTKVTSLKQDETGAWRATTAKDDKSVEAAFDFRKMPLRVVFTVRSEFEPQFAQSSLDKRWTAARSLVPRMTQDELRRVIEGPASVKVIRFESSSLIEQLVNEVVEMPGALPLLSYALSEMYKNYIKRRGDDRSLTFQDYDALKGGVTGSLRVRANEVVDAVDEATARRVLERFVSVEAGAFARRRVPKRELDAADSTEEARVYEIVRRLVEARLIVTDVVGGEPYLELAHDALILGWHRLLGWVREDAEHIAALRLLTPNAEEWALSPQKKSGLLWSDAARVATIKQLRTAAMPGLNGVESKFAQASEKKARRNLAIRWSAVAAIAVLGVGATIAAYLANISAIAAKEALANSQLSQSQFLADQSSRLTDSGNGQAGLLLAAAALPNGDKSCRVDRPLSQEALVALYKAVQLTREIATFDQSAPDGGEQSREPDKVARETDIREVYRAIFSPDKQYLLTVGQDGTARLWNIASRTYSVIYRGSKGRFPYEADFSPDGNLIAIGVTDGGVHVYNRGAGVLLNADALHTMQIQRIRFSSSGKLLATVSADFSARLWSIDGVSINPLPIIVNHLGPVIDVAFNRSETQIVTSDRVGGAMLTSLVDGRHIPLVGHGNGAIFQASFSPNGALVVTASEDNTARLWKADTGELLDIAEGHTKPLSRARFSPDGNSILTASRDGTARIWRIANGAKFRPVAILRGHTARLYDAVFSKSGSRVATASEDGTARIWNIKSAQNDVDVDRGAPLSVEDVAAEVVLSGHSSWVYSVVFSADDELIATASHDGTARVWSATAPKAVRHVSAYASSITLIRHDPRSRRLLTGSQDGELNLWELDSLSMIGSFKAHSGGIVSAEFNANGSQIISGGADGRAILWKIGSEEPLAILVNNGDLISGVGFNPTQDMAFVTSYDGSVRLFNTNDGSDSRKLPGHASWVRGGVFSADGKMLLTWSIDGAAIVWDPIAKHEMRATKLCESSVEQAAFSPLGPEVIGACADGKLAVWRDGIGVQRIQADDKSIRRFAFSSDGKKVVTGADGGKVGIWSTQDWQSVKALNGHNEDITFATFLSDNSHVVSGSQDRTVKIWDPATNELLGIFAGHQRGVVGAVFDQAKHELISASGRELLRFDLFDDVKDLIAYAEDTLSTRTLSGAERKRFGLKLGDQCAPAVKR